MDIVIKSFNRPYYLDRCLYSIDKFVSNFEGNLFILDDGTPQKYLDIIIQKHPKVIIKKSTLYGNKVKYIELGIQPKEYEIPIDLWSEIADEVSDYFLLIEDDTWFVDFFNYEIVVEEMQLNNTKLLKLFWLGNNKLHQNKSIEKKENIQLIQPKLFTESPFLYNLVFRKNYLNLSRRILAKLGIYTFERHMAYYSIYAVAGTILNKNFYKQLWNNHENKVEETLQILNALKFYKNNKNTSTFAKLNKEILKTGFQSSATNQHKEHFEGDIDMFKFNKILNDSWLNNELNTYVDLPKDINSEKIINILRKEGNINPDKWISWIKSFKNQYTSIGCVID